MPSPIDPEDVLKAVKAEGTRRRSRRHRRNGVVAGMALALLAVPAVALFDGNDRPQEVEVAGVQVRRTTTTDGDETTTTQGEASTTTVPPTTEVVASAPTTVAPVVAAPTTEAPAVTAPPRPTTTPTTAPPCRNSTAPSCGTFRWDPQPTNSQLAAAWTAAPTTATVGQQLTFTATWNDADASLVFDNFSPDGAALSRSCQATPKYGPWTPPRPEGGAGSVSYTQTFTQPGTYNVVLSLGTGVGGGGDCDDPYASDAFLSQTVTVTAAP